MYPQRRRCKEQLSVVGPRTPIDLASTVRRMSRSAAPTIEVPEREKSLREGLMRVQFDTRRQCASYRLFAFNGPLSNCPGAAVDTQLLLIGTMR